MDLLCITIFYKLEFNPFNLGQFGVARGVAFILVRSRMIVYGFLSQIRNM